MELNEHHRICPYCGELFEAENGNRVHCPSKNGKKDFCKNQAKRLREIKKRGGRTESERITFLKQNLGFEVSFDFMKKNLFRIKTKNEYEYVEKSIIYSRCHFEGNYALLYNPRKKMYLILQARDVFKEIRNESF